MKVYFTTIYLILVFISSCRQAKKDATDTAAEIVPRLIETKSQTVPLDSMPKWKIVLLENPQVIPAKKPRVVKANSNRIEAGQPDIIATGKPRIIIPGNGSLRLPDTIPFEISAVPCINKPLRKALNPGIIESAYSNMQYLDVEHGLASSYILTIFQDKKSTG